MQQLRLKHIISLFISAVLLVVHGSKVSPINKALQLITDLQAKIIQQGEEAQKVYEEFSEWCEERSRNVDYEIKTAKAEIVDLNAAISSADSNIMAGNAEIERIASAVTNNEADLKAARGIRAKEAEDFKMEEKDLVETISIISRAIGILEREMRKGGSAMLQLQHTNDVVKALRIMVDASMLSTQDAKRLTALVQSNQEADEDDDQMPGAPVAAAYQGHSSSIVETLEDLLDKAKEQLDACRRKETNEKHNFEMLEQSLQDEVKFAGKEMDATKKDLAKNRDAKATASGELQVTSKGLQEDQADKETMHQDCMGGAADFEAATKSRAEELKALKEAKQAIEESTTGSNSIQYGADTSVSLLEIDAQMGDVTAMASAEDLANFEAVELVRNLARRHHDQNLILLAKRMSAVMRQGAALGQDPFVKVKALIMDMIEKLEKDAGSEASQKAYCDKEMGETAGKLTEKDAAVNKLSTQIDSMMARSTQLKEEVAALQKALADLFAAQSSADNIRSQEKENYVKDKAELEQGLEGIKLALKILRDYYAQGSAASHEVSEGVANGVIGLLEVVESDITKGIAEMNIEEQTAQSEYERLSREAQISKATKEQGVKYKTKEFKSLDAQVAETKSDLETTREELIAVQEYDRKIKQICIAKPQTYEERAARREAEIAGLKEALQILKGETMLIQGRAVLRGIRRHTA